MIRPIQLRETKTIVDVSDLSTEAEMRQHCPLFFRTPHGKRETYSTYRGQLIVRNTVKFGNDKPFRATTVYFFFLNLDSRPDLLCVSAGSECNSIAQAKKLIDKIIDGGCYCYGI